MKSTTIVIRTIGAFAFTTALAAAGCTIDSDTGDDSDTASTSQTQQAVSSFGIWSWGCSSSCGLDLGPASGQTCFLAGVNGNLQPAGSYSEVLVEQAPDINGQMRWGIQIVTNGLPLEGTAVCIPGNPVSSGRWSTGMAEVNLGSTSGGSRCFLSGIQNVSGFTSDSDFVQVHTVASGFPLRSTHWSLGGSIASGGSTTASAVCVDTSGAAADFGIVVGDGGSILNAVMQTGSGWACGLKKLGGHFTVNDYNNGLWISYSNSPVEWEVNGVDGKQATIGCVF
jgi:hypothetical protein